jgi:trimeric autotransporter adhesin
MSRMKLSLSVWLLFLVCSAVSLCAQQAASAAANAVVPPVVKFSGLLTDVNSKALTGTVGVMFSLYKDSQGGAALWVETQNVTPDKTGHYSVMLGSTSSQGLPSDLFNSGEARWLGVQVQGQAEQPRTLLMSVPYALKALDAETVGGKPASSFMLTPQAGGNSSAPGRLPPGTITGSGTADFIPRFTGTTTLGNSNIFETVAGNVGIATTTPAAKLDVKGTEDVRNTLTLFPSGTNPALSVHGTAFEVNNTGQVTFVSGQAFPGTGTVTSVGSGAGLSGGPITARGSLSIASGGVTNSMLANPSLTVAAGTDLTGGGKVALGGTTTLNLDTTKVPQLNAANTFTGNQTVNGNLSATVSNGSGAVTGLDQSSSGATGVLGSSINGYGVFGNSTNGDAVYGQSGGGVGVEGLGGPFGVYGTGLTGVAGLSNGNYIGVYGNSTGSSSYGVYGLDSSGTGVYGTGTTGVFGVSTGGAGVAGSSSGGGWGVNGYGGGSDTGVLAGSKSGYAGWFNGDVEVEGNLSKSSGTFKIDHPLDPANKYLYHSFVESPDMMNIYNGVATLDANGEATVRMPDWFGVLNRDFRYQLTCIGGFAPVYIAEELANNQFKIGGGRAGTRVSWQITGIRQDAWANAHRVVAEEEKPENERGFYLHPELFGAPPERGVLWGRSPKAMKQWKEMQAKIAAGSSQPKMESPRPPQVPQLPPRPQVPVKR